jgi:hypothetical protein
MNAFTIYILAIEKLLRSANKVDTLISVYRINELRVRLCSDNVTGAVSAISNERQTILKCAAYNMQKRKR